MVAFGAGLSVDSPGVVTASNLLFAPIFERAILEMWDSRWGGLYTGTNDTIVEFLVDYDHASIELARVEVGGEDVLARVAAQFFGVSGDKRSDVLAYLWPGGDDSAYRYYSGLLPH